MRIIGTVTLAFMVSVFSLAVQAQTSGQSAPSAQTNPAQAAPNAQPNHAQDNRSIDDELQLSPDQKQKIAAIVDDENKQIGALRDDQSMSTNQKMEKLQQIRQVAVPKIRSVLSPQQLDKLAEIQAKRRQEQDQKPEPAPQH